MSTKHKLLQELLAHSGQHFSGQQLADSLGISRMAVNKAARELQKQGWQISAAAGRGYCLMQGSDALSVEAVQAGLLALPKELQSAGQLPRIEVFDTLESTNKTAKELASAGAPHGTLVLAGSQSSGRGRLGRSFVSPAGSGVYFTLILRPGVLASDALAVTGSAAVAVCRAVKRLCGIELSIKWVNDLFWKNKKVCGILTEAATDFESGRVEWLAVGIGLNLTTSDTVFGPELSGIAGSLFAGGVSPVSRAAMAAAISAELLAMCPEFDYLAEYRARCFVPGHWVTVRGSTEPWTAYALEIDDSGRLVVQDSAGRHIALSHGEVSVKPSVVD